MAYSRAVVLAIFTLDIIAFGLAIGAQSRHSQASVTTTKSSTDATLTYCKYSRDASTGLGIAAFVFLFFGQMLITGVTRCLCCSKPLTPGGSRAFAILFFVLSWFSFVIAEICLIAGATKAAYRTRFNTNNQIYDCESLRRGIFSSAAAFSFFTLFLSEAYYWFFCKASDKSWQTFYGNAGGAGAGANPYNPYNPNPFTTSDPPPAYGVPYYNPAGGAPPPAGQTIGMATYPPRAP